MKTKAGSFIKPASAKVIFWLTATFAVLFGVTALVRADDLVQGFAAKGSLQPGWVVAISKDSQQTVEAAPAADSSRIYGVVIDPSDAPVTLNRQLGAQVFVANTGNYPVLVSSERGAIKPGDYLSISSTDGIAALASGDQKSIIGQAVQGFDGKKGVITNAGNFAVGKIIANISPRKNPVVRNDVAVPGFLRKVGEAIAGKPVSAAKIYLAVLFLLAATSLSMTILWAAIRGGMVALGRNPLNRGHIMNSMFKVVTAAVSVFIIGLFGVYLLLKV